MLPSPTCLKALCDFVDGLPPGVDIHDCASWLSTWSMIYTDADADERVAAHQRCSLRFGRFPAGKVGTRRTEGTEVAQDYMQDTKQAAVSSKSWPCVNRLTSVTREWCRPESKQYGYPNINQKSMAQSLSIPCSAEHVLPRRRQRTPDRTHSFETRWEVVSERMRSREEVFRTTPASGTS